MNFGRQKHVATTALLWLSCFSQTVSAVLFDPGVGVGVEYTDNAKLSNGNEVSDVIVTSFAGAQLLEDEGALVYDVTALFDLQRYTQKSFTDQQYLTLGATADWAMMNENLNWFLRDKFTQRTVNSLNANTPGNIQDTNTFIFGADIGHRLSARQFFTLVPMFRQYYYEVQSTDNKQYSLAANWTYQMYRLTNVGLVFNVRKINYTEKNILGETIVGTKFTNLAFIINGQRQRSTFTANLGATNVKRDNGEGNTGFTGYFKWLLNVSSRSTLNTLISTNITDTSRAAVNLGDNPANGGANDIQVTTDVIRNSIFNLAYIREDTTVRSQIAVRYRKVEYSEAPLNQEVQGANLQIGYPVTPLLTSDGYVNYNRSKRIDTNRIDETYTVGGNLKYDFSRLLHGVLDIKYRTKESTYFVENYNELSVFASLVYGFGKVGRATRTGGF